jgi:hypothetical protein
LHSRARFKRRYAGVVQVEILYCPT